MNSSETTLVSRVERAIRHENLFKPGDTLVVALSGGADSTALLDLLSRLPGYNLRLVVAHLNHRLRGAESYADEEFCRGLAARYAVPFEVRRIDVKDLASTDRLNLEDAGRRARIAFFDEIRSAYGATAVVLAHHADDQAETVLMRLLRGSGMTGLSGMAYRNARGYVRPLLEISRLEIEAYLRGQGIVWREDASNSDTVYLRNRVRHELLPLLETYNPAIRSCLGATASIISGDEVLLCELTEQAVADVHLAGDGDGELVCDIAKLRSLSTPLLRRVLRYLFMQVAGTLESVSLSHIDAICDMIISDRPNSMVTLPHEVTPVREYDHLIWRLGKRAGRDTDYELLIPGPGCYQIPSGGSLTVELTDKAAFPPESGTMYIDRTKAPFPWLVRTFRPGDRMTPFGMSGRKKIKDIFIDRKIPISERKQIPLLWCGDDLIWIPGVCASERTRIDTPSALMIRVAWNRG